MPEENNNFNLSAQERAKYQTWILLILGLNLVMLPLMLQAAIRPRPQVLGAQDPTEAEAEPAQPTRTGGSGWDWVPSFQNPFAGSEDPVRRSGQGSPFTSPQDSAPMIRDPQMDLGGNLFQNDQQTNSESSILTGKIIWKANFSGSLAVRNAPVDAEIAIETETGQTQWRTDAITLMPAGVVAVVNQEKFIQLGGDPDTEQELEATINLQP